MKASAMRVRRRRQGFPCRQKLTLPLGDYLLRLGVRDNTTDAIGTADAKVSVLCRASTKNTSAKNKRVTACAD